MFVLFFVDWSYFDVTESPAVNHLQIIPGRLADDSNVASGRISGYYVNKTYIFRLRLRVHGVCPPVIWYHKFENGTEIEGKFLLNNQNITIYLKKVYY